MYKIKFDFEYGYGKERKIFLKIDLISSLNAENVSWHLAKRSIPSSSAEAASERLGSSRSGSLSRPLRLRLRRQQEKRCLSKVRHKCRPYHRPCSLAPGGQVPQTCFRLTHCLGRFAPCGYSLPPALRRADYRLAPVIVLPLWFFVFIVVVVKVVWNFIYQKGSGYSVVLLLLVFLYHISRQENVISLYTVLVQLRIWRLLIIPRFAEILGLP